MGRAFFSDAYRPAAAAPAVTVMASEEMPKRWATAPFDPDADDFLNAEDAVFEDFLTPEQALERAQAQAADQVAAARAARFDSPAASTDSSGAATPVTEQPLPIIPAMRWANGQWTFVGTEPTPAGAASETSTSVAIPLIRSDLHALPGAFPADAFAEWVSPATSRQHIPPATPPSHGSSNIPSSTQDIASTLAMRAPAPQTPRTFTGSPSSAPVVTPRIHAWLGSPSSRLSRAHVAPSMIEVPHVLG